MEGVQILSSSEITYSVLGVAGFWVGVSIFSAFILAVAASWIFGNVDCGEGFAIIGCGFLIALLLGFMTSTVFGSKIQTGRYKHKALIEDGVDFKQLYEKYNIVGMDGKMYILEDQYAIPKE